MSQDIYLKTVLIVVNSTTRLNDEDYLRKFLDDVVQAIDMTIIHPTICVKLPLEGSVDPRGRPLKEGDEGLSLVTLIAESHITVHTWSKLGKIFIDISSCKEFECQPVLDLVGNYFSPSNVWHTPIIINKGGNND